MKAYYCYDTALGKIGIAQNETGITHLYFEGGCAPAEYEQTRTPLLDQAARQLLEYLNGERFVFDLPFEPQGTEFQRKVWRALQNIPYGETRSYKDIAQEIGAPKAARAVGGANNKNPIAIMIPCHRVVGAGGSLVGYAYGLGMKETLLHLERRFLPALESVAQPY